MMRTVDEIIDLANAKLRTAEILLGNDRPDDAYYIGGYAFELLLKAKICKTLAIPDLYHSSSMQLGKKNVGNNYTKTYHVHDYAQLIMLSGLYNHVLQELETDSRFYSDWQIVSNWNEKTRYKTGQSIGDASSFIESLKNMMLWLQRKM